MPGEFWSTVHFDDLFQNSIDLGPFLTYSCAMTTSSEETQYDEQLSTLLLAERSTSLNAAAIDESSPIERQAARIVQAVKEHERHNVYQDVASESLPSSGSLEMGGQYLTNRATIEESTLFDIVRRLPKGADLHVHYNSCLPPEFFLQKARNMQTMFVKSSKALVDEEDYFQAEIIFNVLPANTPVAAADLFQHSYTPGGWMTWLRFCDRFREIHGREAEDWIQERLVITEEEAYGVRATHNG